MGTTSPAVAVTLTNTGGASLTVTSVSTSTYFAVSHGCATLAAGASCTASVTFTPTAQGSLNGTLTVQSSAGTLTVPLAGTGERSLVTHYYRSILRRAPDAGGKSFWEAEAARVQALGLNVNEVWFAMAGSFFASAEYLAFGRDNAGFVTDLYNTFFNRPPDGAGLAYWTGELAGGLPREVALVAFMFSAEFVNFTQSIFGATAVRAEIDAVTDFFRGLLGRLPDDGGFGFWVGQFRTAQCAGGAAVNAQVESISSQYALSQEYANRARSNAQYVGDLYNAFLRRGAVATSPACSSGSTSSPPAPERARTCARPSSRAPSSSPGSPPSSTRVACTDSFQRQLDASISILMAAAGSVVPRNTGPRITTVRSCAVPPMPVARCSGIPRSPGCTRWARTSTRSGSR